MQGWIKLHRKIIENPIFMKPELLQLFLYCLIKANHEPKKMIFNGNEMTIERGQFVTGRDVLSRELKQNGRTTYDRLKILEKLEILSIKSNNKFSTVTIVNYDLYQINEEETNSNTNNQPTTSQQPANTNKNIKNYKKNIYDDFFEKVWSLYPRKEGKGSVSMTQKEKLYKIGLEEITRTIERYKDKLKKDGTESKYIKQGSTFFNSGYIDYLDKNYKDDKPTEPPDHYRRVD